MIDLRCGDCLEVMRGMPDKSVQCCVTSPPYYGLRDYGVDGQIGLEQTPEKYIANLVAVFREVRRVLRNDGTLWLNLGDSYASVKSRYSSRPQTISGKSRGEPQASNKPDLYGNKLGIKDKDLLMIPASVAIALRTDGWYLRSQIVWYKPNPMPESVKDRPTKSHEMIYLLSKSARYYYDAQSVLESAAYDGRKDTTIKPSKKYAGRNMMQGSQPQQTGRGIEQERWPQKLADGTRGRSRRDVWAVNTTQYKGAHFATFPPKLIEPCILAGCPVGGIVIDPFSGAGTTGIVALQHGRSFIGIELNPEYLKMAEARIEMENKLMENKLL